jgi:hypothetical protein
MGGKKVRAWNYYFPVVSSLLLLFSIAAFSDNLFTDIGQDSNKDPKFIIHGLFMFAWLGTFVAQTFFILRKNYKAHVKLGRIGFVLAICVFLSTVYVFIAVFEGWEAMEPFVKANRLLMLSFAFFTVLAYKYRKDAIKHKRFIFWAIVLPIEPMMGRVSDLLQVENWELFYAGVWHAFFISFLVYDYKNLGKVHPISIAALTWFYLTWGIAIYS